MSVKQLEEIFRERVGVGEGTYKQVLIGADEAPNFAMRRFIIEPGGFMPKHTNTVEHEQFVLGGEAEVGLGDEVLRVKKNRVVFIPAGIPHWYRCVGEEPFEFLCIVPNAEDRIEIIDE